MEERMKRYLARLRPELLAMVSAVDPQLWEKIRHASAEQQILALATSFEVMQGVSHHVLGQAGFEQGSLIQRRGEGSIYVLDGITVDWNHQGTPERIFFYGSTPKESDEQVRLLGESGEFSSLHTGLTIDGPELFELLD
jgi:hypothetical protein